MEFEKVRDIIVETLGCDAEQVTPTASLADDLGADSPAAPMDRPAGNGPGRHLSEYGLSRRPVSAQRPPQALAGALALKSLWFRLFSPLRKAAAGIF